MNRRLFMAGLAGLLALPVLNAHAAERLTLGINTGMASADNQLDLREKYRPLANYLSDITGRPVRLEVSQNLDSTERRLQRDAYDLFLGPPQTIAQAMKDADYVPLVRYSGKIRSAFVVMESGGINRLSDARGKKIGLPEDSSLPSYLAFAKLRFSRIKPAEYFTEVYHLKFQDAVMDALKIGRVDIAVATSGYAKKWVQDNPGSKIIDETYEVPHFALAASPALSEAEQQKIRRALIEAQDSEKGAVMLETLGRKSGFIATSKDEFSPLIRLFGL